jgi:predicted lipoprotein with Yx(FWY)xxD motif
MIGRRLTLASLATIALIAAACSSSGGATPSPTATAAPPSVAPSAAPSVAASPSASAEESPSASSASGDYPLAVATVSAGKTLTGEGGMTLYIFKADTKDSGKSTCNGDCAIAWPPYTLDADETLAPTADATGTVTMITRDDGTKQVAYNGWPLYYFKADKAAGDAKGQNIDAFGGIWLIATP